MAVTETVFRNSISTTYDLMDEVLAWCQENLSEYFDVMGRSTYSTDELRLTKTNSSGITTAISIPCRYAGNAIFGNVTISTNASGSFQDLTDNVGINVGDGLAPTVIAPTIGYKTSSGAAIRLGTTYSLIVTKTGAGDTALVLTAIYNSNNTQAGAYIIDFGAPMSMVKTSAFASISALNKAFRADGALASSHEWMRTSFAPVIFPGTGGYNEGLMLTSFLRHQMTGLNLYSADGTQYVCNGAFALRE